MYSEAHISKGSATSDAPLIATNDDAFQSKVAAMRAGYFEDKALATMAEKYAALRTSHETFRRPPVINRGTFARVLLKETLVEAFLSNSCKDGMVPQIISIGAGFDTQPLALVKNAKRLPPFHYVELDFAQVVREKATFVKESLLDGEGCSKAVRGCSAMQGTVALVNRKDSSVSPECTDIKRAKAVQLKDGSISLYCTAGVDLRDLQKVGAVLDELAISWASPTLIVAEIVLVYMDAEHSDALISLFSKRLTGLRAFMVIEHTCQDSDFGRQMELNIAARGSPLRGLRWYPTMESQKVRFEKLGWAHVRVESLLRAFERRVSDRLALNRIEILDEVEEWSLIMSHYCIVCATDGCMAEELLEGLDVGKRENQRFRGYQSGGAG